MLNSYKNYADVVRLSDAFVKLSTFPAFIEKKNIPLEDILKLIHKNYEFFGYTKKPSVKQLKNIYANGCEIGGGSFTNRTMLVQSFANFKKATLDSRTSLQTDIKDVKQKKQSSDKDYKKIHRKITGLRVGKAVLIVAGLAALGGAAFGGFLINGAIAGFSVLLKTLSWAGFGATVLAAGGILAAPAKAIWNKLSDKIFKHKMNLLGNGTGTVNDRAYLKQKQKVLDKNLKNNMQIENINANDSIIIKGLEQDITKLAKINQARQNVQPNVQQTSNTRPLPRFDRNYEYWRNAEQPHEEPESHNEGIDIPLAQYDDLSDITVDKANETLKKRQVWYDETIAKLTEAIGKNKDFELKGNPLEDTTYNTCLNNYLDIITDIKKYSTDMSNKYAEIVKDIPAKDISAEDKKQFNEAVSEIPIFPMVKKLDNDIPKELFSKCSILNYRAKQSKEEWKNLEKLSNLDVSKVDEGELSKLVEELNEKLHILEGVTSEKHGELIKDIKKSSEEFDKVDIKETLKQSKKTINDYVKSNKAQEDFEKIVSITSSQAKKARKKDVKTAITDFGINIITGYNDLLSKKSKEIDNFQKSIKPENIVTTTSVLDKFLTDNDEQFKTNAQINDLYVELLKAKIGDIQAFQKAKENDAKNIPPEPGAGA